MVIKTENGVAVGHPLVDENFRLLFPNISFPEVLTQADVAPYGYAMFSFTDKPTPARYEKIEEATPGKNPDGSFTQAWAKVQMSAQERSDVDATNANSVRNARNTLLTMSDWTQIADAPVDSAAWAVYRQSLRDVTSQAGFPWNVTWPSKPE